jgi:hypothetical protein
MASGGIRDLISALAFLLVMPAVALAGGTLAFSELVPLLRQRPQLSGFLFQAYRLPNSAFAAVRLGSHFPHLGGSRLGPYMLQVQPRDSSAAAGALISLCTRHVFLDRSGNPLPESDAAPMQATAVREELTAVVIREPAAIDYGFGCP